MPSQRRKIRTSVSWFGLVFLFAACDASPATSLAGPTPCEGMTCGSGQICHAEVAQDAGINATCVDPPDGCVVADCVGTCPDCLAKLCAYYAGEPLGIEVEGRTLTCPSY
jgi:hypothetical protein